MTSLHIAPASAAPARQLVREFNRGRLPADSLSLDGQLHSSGVNQPAARAQSGSERFSGLAEKEATAQRKGEASGVDVNQAFTSPREATQQPRQREVRRSALARLGALRQRA